MNGILLGLFKKRKFELLKMAYLFLRWGLIETIDRMGWCCFYYIKKERTKFWVFKIFRVGGLGFG